MIVSHHRIRRGVSALAIVTVAFACQMQGHAYAAGQTAAQSARISVPAQDMDGALDAIASQSGTRILFDRSGMQGIASRSVSAGTVREALGQAIAGTALEIAVLDDGTLVVQRADGGEIRVIATRDRAELAYDVNEASSSSRDGKALRDQPQSTTVVTGKLVADQQVQTVYEALRNVSGATVNTGNVQGAATFTTRGFLVRPLNGGLNDPAGIAPPIVGVERIEVLKGPAAVLAGADNLGGTANIVTKKAVAEPMLELTGEYGSYEDRRFAVDGSTALNPAKTVSARLVLQHARADRNFAGYDGRFENFINPMMRFFDGDTDANISLQASDVRQPMTPYATFNQAGDLIDLSDHPVGPREQGFRLENLRLAYDVSHKFNDWLTVVSRGHRSETHLRLKVFAPAGVYGPDLALLLGTNERQETTTWADDTYARLSFGTFGVAHTVSVGFNYSKTTQASYAAEGFTSQVPVYTFFSDPYNIPDREFPHPGNLSYTAYSEQTGYYFQDFVEFGPLHLLGAVRHTKYDSHTDIPGNVSTPYSASATTPNFGAVLDLTSTISVYGNFMRGFIPSFLMDVNDQQLPPRRSRNIEGGIKFTLPGLLSATASVYKLRETNVSVAVPGYTNRYSTIDGQESKGVEFDLTASPVKGWNVIGSYSYANYDLSQQTAAVAVVAAQPEHRYSFFTRYDLQSGPLKDLGASVGVFGYSKSYAGTTGNYELPASTQVDAHLYYAFGPVSANFGVENVFDKTNYGVSTASSFVPVRAPRTFRLTLTYSAL